MTLRPRRPLAWLLLVFFVLLARLCWTLGLSTDSWRLLADEWHEQACLIFQWQPPVPYRTPPEQAAYWIKQTEKMNAAQQDAQAALGAAWMLDSPCSFFEVRFDKNINSHPSSEAGPQSTAALNAKFESLTREACLQQSERATHLDPQDKQLWRNRALLLFQFQNNSSLPHVFIPRRTVENWEEIYSLVPRTERWQEILDECARHDPDNALYDYLAAIYLWSQSTQKGAFFQTVILDPPQYQQAQQRLQAGLKKPFLKSGSNAEAATLSFLSHTTFSWNQQARMAENRKRDFREKYFLYRLFQFQDDELSSLKDFKDRAVRMYDYQKLAQQLSAGNVYDNFAMLGKDLFWGQKIKLITLNRKDSSLFEPAEFEALLSDFRQILLEQETFNKARKQFRQEIQISYTEGPWFFQFALLSAISVNLIIVTLTCSLVGLVLSWLGKPDPDSELVSMGFWRPLVCWLLGILFSFALLFAVNKLPLLHLVSLQTLQYARWIAFPLLVLGLLYLFYAGLWGAYPNLLGIGFLIALLVLILYSDASLSRLWSQVVLLSLITLAAVSLPFVVHALRKPLPSSSDELQSQPRFLFISGLALGIAVMTVTWGIKLACVDHTTFRSLGGIIYPLYWRSFVNFQNIDGEVRNLWGLFHSGITIIGLGWYWLAGELFAAFFAISMLLLWYLKRLSRTIAGGFPALLQTRKRFTLYYAGHMLARSCAITALLFSLVYLAIAPSFLPACQTQILNRYQRLNDYTGSEKKIRAIQAEIEADKQLMDQLRRESALYEF